MYLKSLTLKGFKSFASSTTMQLEPGITCIVGPNGSGKSNVVDALAWVMGEQGAKSLRGGKMEDVIFAGTSGRPPLGRAEVLLTIDNSDGALPIEYAEVTISRTMFRSGGSEYAINGSSCRLLDVQELLSDSGIGREMHVIVGQGQLDTILHATPEDRRGFIEEAAGVLKHRKRKEKALRKLDSTEGNLTRLSDLLSEIRRQLKPLGRQAEVARKAAAVQADVRDARARLMADDLVTARTSLEQEMADESILVERRGAGRGPARRGARGRGGPGGGPARGPAGAVPGPGDVVRALRPPRAAARHPVAGRRAGAQRRGHRRERGGRLRPRPRPARGRGRAGPPAGAADRGGGRAQPGRCSSRPSRPARPPRTPPPRRTAASPGCSAPPPTGVRAWPACTARSTRSSPAPLRPTTRSAGWGSPARRPSPAPSVPSATSRRWRPGSPASTPARRGSTPSTRPPPPSSTTSRSAWPRPARRSVRPTATGPRSRPARTRSRWASTARTVPARCSRPPTPSPACSAPWPRCCRCAAATRPRSPGRWARPPTRSPSPTPTPRWPRSTTSRATTSAGPGCCSAAAPPTTPTGPACPATRRTPSTWSSAPPSCVPR